jgi:hypothetical protein
MDEDKTQMLESRAVAVCEEFCRYVVTDTFNKSILTNTQHDFYAPLVRRLKQLGYVELFRASVHPCDTITSTFLHTEFE